MNELRNAVPAGTLTIKPKLAIIGVLAVSIFAVFIDVKLSIVFGPIMAVAMAYLYFFGYPGFVTAIIIIANNDLGTIVMGSVSFQHLLLGLALIRLLLRGKIRLASVGVVMVALVLLVQLYFVDFLPMRNLIYSMTYVLGLLTLPQDEKSLQQLFRGIAFTVVLISLHACVTGGVEFYEVNKYSSEVLRKGIIGVGIGDANFSCYLLVIGLLCVWYEKELAVFWKVVFTGMILYSMMITLSVTGLLALILAGVLAALLGKKKGKSIVTALVVVLVVILAFQAYMELPLSMRNEALDGYIARVEEKIIQIRAGNLAGATTNRSDLAVDYLAYIFKQDWSAVFFGGNSLNVVGNHVPHNTYIGFALQVGLVGAAVIIAWMIWKLIKILMGNSNPEHRQLIILLKSVSLFFAATLSFYQGNLWSLWLYFLLSL